MASIDAVLERHADQLARLTDDQARAFMRAYHDARRLLRERLDGLESIGQGGRWTAQHTRASLAQIEQGIAQMEQRLSGLLLNQSITMHSRAYRDLAQVVRPSVMGAFE